MVQINQIIDLICLIWDTSLIIPELRFYKLYITVYTSLNELIWKVFYRYDNYLYVIILLYYIYQS